MKVLVTGGAGFIGSHVADALIARGDRVVIVDNLSTGKKENLPSGAAFYSVDIRDAAALADVLSREKPDRVNHHAAQTDVRRSMEEPAYDAQVNVLGTVNLLRLCVQHKIQKVVFASSSAVYPEPEYVPVREDHPIRPVSAYGLTKHIGENYLQLYRDACGLAFTAFRYGNVYGPRQDPSGEAGVVAIFCGQMLAGVQPTLFGDGRKTRDYVYVNDVVAANLLALDGAGDDEVFNIGWGREVSDFEVFDAVRRAMAKQVEPVYASKRPGELDRIALDSSKAARRLSWVPRIPFEEGILRCAEHYRRRSA